MYNYDEPQIPPGTGNYDLDGNAIIYQLPVETIFGGGIQWDGENRMVNINVFLRKGEVAFYYDAQSRLIAKKVASEVNATFFVYDGWNPIAEYTGSVGVSPTLTKTYTWGIDLSGSLQGAGGVGGLLALEHLSIVAPSAVFYPTYDGNGNVSEYLDSTGAIAAHYEYDPFGKTTVSTGAKANDFAHRFSTKPIDATTGLYYYGYRFYDPNTGRWLNRDPLGEEGGVNLYGFVGNDSINFIDILGLSNDRYVTDNSGKHGGPHVDRYDKGGNNTGRYNKDGSGIPHKGKNPPQIPKSDMSKFLKAATKLNLYNLILEAFKEEESTLMTPIYDECGNFIGYGT